MQRNAIIILKLKQDTELAQFASTPLRPRPVAGNPHDDFRHAEKGDYLDAGLRIEMYLLRRSVRYLAKSFAIAFGEFVLAYESKAS